MHTVSLEHVQLTNRLRAYENQLLEDAAAELRRFQAMGGVDLEQAAEVLSLSIATRFVARQREINRERLVEYLVNGLGLDIRGLPAAVGSTSEEDLAFVRLSAKIDEASARPGAHESPWSALTASWVAAERSVYRFKAWAATHSTCGLN